jgi:signal transduction histidine kinase
MNEIAASVIKGGRYTVYDYNVNLRDVLRTDDLDLENLERTSMTLVYKSDEQQTEATRQFFQHDKFYELQLVPYRDKQGNLQTIYGTGRDITEAVNAYKQIQRNSALLQQANDEVSQYIRNTNFVLQNGGVRMTDYSPDTHMLVIYSRIGREQYRFTQTRCLSLLDDESKKIAQRGLNAMDNRSRQPIDSTLKTTIRIKDGKTLYLHLSFIPVIGNDGEVTSYFGMCRDISELRAMEEALALETSKAQEVETVKNAFLHNMSYEIRTPLNSVVGFADLFEQEHSKEDEELFIREIRDNSEHLLALINDILFLSRLDAHMIEIKPQMTDICVNFETRCQTIIFRNQQPGVEYSIENPYEHLVVEVDEQNLGIAIDQLLSHATFFTTEGQVRVRCDYTGEELIIALHANKWVVLEHILPHIFDRFIQTRRHGTGLELSICNELIHQMGGKIRIKSDATTGTIVWISVPCKCSELVRK